MGRLIYICLLAFVFSCANNPIDLHVPLKIPINCIFEKYTDAEIESMSENVGRKTYRNQESCRLRNNRINDIIRAHNTTHSTN